MSVSSAAVAEFLAADHVGEERSLVDFDGLDLASERDLSFYVGDEPDALRETDAGAVVCGGDLPAVDGVTLLSSPAPKADFCRAVAEFFVAESSPEASAAPDVHPTATVEDGAVLGDDCTVGPGAYVADCVRLGDGCEVQAGAVVGTGGFNFTPDDDGELHYLPHKGEVVIGDDVRVGANTTIDRGVFEATTIGRGTKLDSNVKIGHNAAVGEDVRIATGAELSGSVVVGDRAYVHPQVAVASHTTVGDDAEIGIGSTVVEDVEAGSKVVDPTRPRRIG